MSIVKSFDPGNPPQKMMGFSNLQIIVQVTMVQLDHVATIEQPAWHLIIIQN